MRIEIFGVLGVVATLTVIPCIAQAQAQYTDKEEMADTTSRVEQEGAIDHATGQQDSTAVYDAQREQADQMNRAAESERQERLEPRDSQ